ncbi:peptidase family M1-domain-containing protein [Polychytrium aggregatum]|uniref:peptidase family M1-domain-containing protein n=1 Tax=Polychytrium aggregatum TaxID=110093 RepID=UPI0022FE8DB7|nr:peptidase family M1-domain-containing protein [Polychytrium aggregatum]KAI9197080.1 peptidase family M1-domain-containing protein [Polychytrium aggregatum]
MTISAPHPEETSVRLSPHVVPRHYTLDFRPDLRKLKFNGSVEIQVQVLEPVSVIRFHAVDLDISDVRLDGKAGPLWPKTAYINPQTETVDLTFASPVEPQDYVLAVRFRGTIKDRVPRGFYRSSYVDDNDVTHYLGVTDFEPNYARCAFPCFDEPALKAVFQISITSNLPVLSNMPVQSVSPAGKHRLQRFSFEPTPVQSTYLVAWAIGEMTRLESFTKSGMPVGVYTQPGNEEYGGFSLDIATKSTDYFAELFDYPLPVPKMDHFPVPDYISEGMENWGLVTYEDDLLMCDVEASPAEELQEIAMLITHEVAHQWFGNLVTMKWWDDLWLNEGFAEYMQYRSADKLYPAWDLLSQFFYYEHMSAFGVDDTRFTHPVAMPISDPKLLPTVFDTVTYNKGASIIRMLENWIESATRADGAPHGQFWHGLRHYIQKYALSTASTADLWQCLDDSASVLGENVVSTTMASWISKPGFPVVTVAFTEGHVELGQFRFTLWRHAADEPSDWIIPVAYSVYSLDHDGKPALVQGPTTVLLSETTKVSIPQSDNTLLVVNPDRVGFYRTLFDSPEYYQKLARWLKSHPSAFSAADRAGALSDAWALALSNRLDIATAMSVSEFLAIDRDPTVWRTAIDVFERIDVIVGSRDPALLALWKTTVRDWIKPLAAELGWHERDDISSHQAHFDSLLRSAIIAYAVSLELPAIIAEGVKIYNVVVNNRNEEVSEHMVDLVYQAAICHAPDPHEVFETLLHPDDEMPGDPTEALGCVQLPELQTRLIKHIRSGKLRPQDVVPVLENLARTNPSGTHHVWEFLHRNPDRYLKTSRNVVKVLVEDCVARLEDPEQISQAFASVGGEGKWDVYHDDEPGATTAIRSGLERLNAAKLSHAALKSYFAGSHNSAKASVPAASQSRVKAAIEC